MKPSRISVDQARQYFQHRSQQRASGITPDELPDEPFQYWACEGVCGAFHPDHWPGVWMAHYAVKPEHWGRTIGPAKSILQAFWASERPSLIIGWTAESNRAALSFSRRLGFREIGKMALDSGNVIMKELGPWVLEQQ
ncbi:MULTISPECIES: GNAT family N-acetyltransferase [unclassified Phaeobacter]|uniref:GNAT family N-acetyltransferase n=1 Tax=unclassified Phaeobacter TaxID=2621772 RepID=UPI003A8799F8